MIRSATPPLTALLLTTVLIGGCAAPQATAPSSTPEARESFAASSSVDEHDNLRRGTQNGAWRSTYVPPETPPTIIRNATIMTAAGETLQEADIVLQDGKILPSGQTSTRLQTPAWWMVSDAT